MKEWMMFKLSGNSIVWIHTWDTVKWTRTWYTSYRQIHLMLDLMKQQKKCKWHESHWKIAIADMHTWKKMRWRFVCTFHGLSFNITQLFLCLSNNSFISLFSLPPGFMFIFFSRTHTLNVSVILPVIWPIVSCLTVSFIHYITLSVLF